MLFRMRRIKNSECVLDNLFIRYNIQGLWGRLPKPNRLCHTMYEQSETNNLLQWATYLCAFTSRQL